MKQGRGSDVSSGQKREPNSRAVSQDRTAAIGVKQMRTTAAPPLFKSQGFKAPGTGSHKHPSGSQGKHR